MEISKKNIISIIEKVKKNDFKIVNVNIFGSELLIDISTTNPTLQSKKILKLLLDLKLARISKKS